MNEVSPCKGCTDRHPACHGSCEKYNNWVEQYRAQQRYLQANKNRWERPWSPATERSYRKENRYGAYGHDSGGKQ